MKLIKVFQFDESNRSKIKLGPSVRLDPADGFVKLVGAPYSTAADLYFKTWLARPGAARSWFGFQAETIEPSNTNLGFRLSPDGVAELWWNGSAWTIANSGQWNTQDEICANIGTFPIKQRGIQAIANLHSSNSNRTPMLKSIKIGYEADIDFDEDLIARSLLPALRGLRAKSKHVAKFDTSSSTFNTGSIETPYNIISIDAAFNESSDPALSNNIFQTFDSKTGLITLSSSLPAGASLQIHFTYAPEVALATSQDYVELAKIPAVLVERVSESKCYEIPEGDHIIQDKSAGVAWQLEGCQQRDIELDISWICSKGLDMSRLGSQLESFFHNGTLRSVGMDEEYSLQLVDTRNFSPSSNQNETQTARLIARVRAALFYTREAKQVFVVKRLVTSGGNFQMTVE